MLDEKRLLLIVRFGVKGCTLLAKLVCKSLKVFWTPFSSYRAIIVTSKLYVPNSIYESMYDCRFVGEVLNEVNANV
ncbi:hypothetical protein [Archaeoglobus veneficus]|uniref:Uncharacterized protein n=1 Tax=Archaeoglobus veneficus (strain DSM 11195 / SNP6) TaxID=693661 RepID=F2KMM8_ARCVS|nr:hypothetical protein [Archaeoglobus veneficus]AEA47225.1 hypothetical protein Arcve_1218 [Archaeoglobus veneficus SNP6]